MGIKWKVTKGDRSLIEQITDRAESVFNENGLLDHNFPAFNTEVRRLRGLEYIVVNPADLNKNHPSRAECMRRDIRALTTCDIIQLLPGWNVSEGATLELIVAIELGMTVFDPYHPITDAYLG